MRLHGDAELAVNRSRARIEVRWGAAGVPRRPDVARHEVGVDA